MVNAVGPLGRARSRRNQGKVDKACRNLKKGLDDELNSYQTCTRIILVLVLLLKDTLHKYAVQSIPNVVQSEPMSFITVENLSLIHI